MVVDASFKPFPTTLFVDAIRHCNGPEKDG